MRIGLYGMPTAGKTYILDKVDFMEVLVGSRLLREYDPDFDIADEGRREADRKAVAQIMMAKDEFIMDGHYAFGDEVAFTDEEGEMYDIYLYLYVSPSIIKSRMEQSEKNRKYLRYDIEAWQNREIDGLREYCHLHCKDFYVIDNPPENTSEDADTVVEFLKDIKNGYSCAAFAKNCAEQISADSSNDIVVLADGDKTITVEDSSSRILGYKTHLYDGNYYTGYQAWKQDREFKEYSCPELEELPIHFNAKVVDAMQTPAYILTSGHKDIWKQLSKNLGIPCFLGIEMAAETKLYITKYLQKAGKKVIAYGDGMNDYYMLKQADQGFLVRKADGTISRSLKGKNLEGIILV